MSEIESFIQWITELIGEHLYAGVFLAALIETVFPPVPTLAIFPVAGYIASQNNLDLFSVINIRNCWRNRCNNWFNCNLSGRMEVRTSSSFTLSKIC